MLRTCGVAGVAFLTVLTKASDCYQHVVCLSVNYKKPLRSVLLVTDNP